MKYIISWGGGVNSTGILAMMKLGMLPQFTKENSIFVFADTMAEMPHFYEHTNICLSSMAKEGWKVKRVHPEDTSEYYSKRNCIGLIDYCLEKTVIPSRVNRWCTMEYKSKPIKNYRKSLDTETILILGIGADEPHRAKARYQADTLYPLIEAGVDREKCLELSKEAGLPEPKKTGCYFCPYQRKQQWLDLYHYHKDLFDIAQNIEDTARIKFKGKAYYFVRDLRLTEQIQKWKAKIKGDCKQQEFAEFELDRHCFCAD